MIKNVEQSPQPPIQYVNDPVPRTPWEKRIITAELGVILGGLAPWLSSVAFHPNFLSNDPGIVVTGLIVAAGSGIFVAHNFLSPRPENRKLIVDTSRATINGVKKAELRHGGDVPIEFNRGEVRRMDALRQQRQAQQLLDEAKQKRIKERAEKKRENIDVDVLDDSRLNGRNALVKL